MKKLVLFFMLFLLIPVVYSAGYWDIPSWWVDFFGTELRTKVPRNLNLSGSDIIADNFFGNIDLSDAGFWNYADNESVYFLALTAGINDNVTAIRLSINENATQFTLELDNKTIIRIHNVSWLINLETNETTRVELIINSYIPDNATHVNNSATEYANFLNRTQQYYIDANFPTKTNLADNITAANGSIKSYVDGLNGTWNATELDGIDSTQFLRSDINDTLGAYYLYPNGTNPILLDHLVNKEFVELAVAGLELDYFFSNNPSDIPGYFFLNETEGIATESVITSYTLSAGNDQLIFNFSTDAGLPFIFLSEGIYDAHIHLEKVSGGAQTISPSWTLSKRNSSGEFLIMNSEISNEEITSAKKAFDLHAVFNEDVFIVNTDRLVFKLFVDITGGGTSTVNFYMEGLTDSHFTFRTPSSTLSNIFVRRDGINQLTANWVAGPYNITAKLFKGIFNWIIGANSTDYLHNNGTELTFNDDFLNKTILDKVEVANKSMKEYVDASGDLTLTELDNETLIRLQNESWVKNLETNETTRVDLIIGTYIPDNTTYINDSSNAYADTRDKYFNDSLGEHTVDTDTTYTADEGNLTLIGTVFHLLKVNLAELDNSISGFITIAVSTLTNYALTTSIDDWISTNVTVLNAEDVAIRLSINQNATHTRLELDNETLIRLGNVSWAQTIAWTNVTAGPWIRPENVVDIDLEDICSGDACPFAWNISGTNVFLQDPSWNVGFGTDSPNFKVDIYRNLNATNISGLFFKGDGSLLTGIAGGGGGNCSGQNSCDSIIYNNNVSWVSSTPGLFQIGNATPLLIGNCSGDQSCDNVIYTTDKLGNTTQEIRDQFTGGANITITNGVISINDSYGVGVSGGGNTTDEIFGVVDNGTFVRNESTVWVNRLNVTDNIYLGSSAGDHRIYFYTGGVEYIGWNEGSHRFDIIDGLYVSDSLLVEEIATFNSDIVTTGAGDDLWLGTATQANALFRAYGDGRVFAGGFINATNNITFSAGGIAGWIKDNGTHMIIG